MAPRPGVTDWWARGGLRACGTQRGRWTRPCGTGCRCRCRPLADRARFLAGYAAGIEDGLEVSRAA